MESVRRPDIAMMPLQINLPRAERRRLEGLARGSIEPKLIDRYRAVLWCADGKTAPEIAKLLGRHRDTVRRWLRDYVDFGHVGIEPREIPGRPPLLDEEAVLVLIDAVERGPGSAGYDFTRWTARSLASHLSRTLFIEVSPDTVRRTLKKNGYAYLRPKLHLGHRQDPKAKRNARRRRNRAIAKARDDPEGCVFLYQDECEIHLNPCLAYVWARVGSRRVVPSAGQNRRLALFGAVDALTGTAHILIFEGKTTDEFIAFLSWLIELPCHQGKRLYVFMDNCSIHNSKRSQRFIFALKGCLKVIWNAPYTPELNLIERFWKHLKETAICNEFFGDLEGLKSAVVRAVVLVVGSEEHRMNLKTGSGRSFSRAA